MTDLCNICRTRPVESREHVWSDWYLKHLDGLGRPAGRWSANGRRITNRDDVPYEFDRRQRVLLPVCERCNHGMNQRVEVSAKDPVRRLVASRWAGSATSDEWRSVGTWLAKVLLMLGMKESRYETPRIDEAAVRFGSEPPDLDWLADPGSVIPQSLSLWVYNCDPDDEQPGLRFPVPRTVVYSDGTAPTVFHTMTVATQGLAATVLSHPGWEIEHPLVEAGEAWELLHAPPQGDGDLSLLPQHGPKGIRWTTFVPLLRGPEETVRMPPLRATDDWPAPQELLDLVEGISF